MAANTLHTRRQSREPDVDFHQETRRNMKRKSHRNLTLRGGKRGAPSSLLNWWKAIFLLTFSCFKRRKRKWKKGEKNQKIITAFRRLTLNSNHTVYIHTRPLYDLFPFASVLNSVVLPPFVNHQGASHQFPFFPPSAKSNAVKNENKKRKKEKRLLFISIVWLFF